jgi:hypothetical protein
MSISRKTSSEYAQDIKTAILDRNASYDVEVGPIPDLVVVPISNVFELQNERIRAVQQLLSLVNDGSFTDADLNDFVFNEQLVRLTGSKAQVSLTFSRATLPTSNIVVKANFPVGTLADETTGKAYTFLTLSDATLVAANASSYFNNDTQRYELSVAAEAIIGAASSNVGPNRITRPLRPLVGFDSVYNKLESTGGKDIETNAELIDRYYLSLIGTSPDVVNGINKIVRNTFTSVVDSNVVFGNNPFNTRAATDGGAVDVYVIGNTPVTYTETIIFSGVDQVIPLSKQPINSVLAAGLFVQGTDFVFVKSTGGYKNSVRATDGIKWLPTGSYPAVGTAVSVTYVYNILVSTLQDGFVADEKNVPGRDILFKVADQIDTTLSANVKVMPGFSIPLVINAISTSLLALVNGNLLNDDVEGSDIQAVVRSFSSIDNFIITNLSKVGQTGTADIIIGDNEYSRINPLDLIVTPI